jgi:4-alpha-glucanotransferase
MNQPGRASGAWKWKLRPGALTPELAARLREATDEAGRLA